MVGKNTECYKQTSQYLQEILEGVVVSIDPSIGSSSSQPGWAVYRQSKLVASGVFDIPAHKSVWERLRRLANAVRKLYKKFNPDILIYEEIPAQRYGLGGNAGAHASLLKAVGAILSVPGTEGCVGIHPQSWKKLARADYSKGDEADAVEMGWVVIELARYQLEQRERKRDGRPKVT